MSAVPTEAMAAPEGLPRYPLHFASGVPAEAVARWVPTPDDATPSGRLRRHPASVPNMHWAPPRLAFASGAAADHARLARAKRHARRAT